MRLILIGVGLLIIVLVYLWGTRQSIRARLEKRRRRDELDRAAEAPAPESRSAVADTDAPSPVTGDFSAVSPDHPLADQMLVDVEITPVSPAPPQPPPQPQELPAVQMESAESPPPATVREEPEKTMLLMVAAPRGQFFKGPQIARAMAELHLELGSGGVFHYFSHREETRTRSLIRVGHLREPGTFEFKAMAALATPGLLLYMYLPAPVEATEAVDELLFVAQQLAEKLGGTIYDEHRKPLTRQTMMHLRKDAADFERKRRISRLRG